MQSFRQPSAGNSRHQPYASSSRCMDRQLNTIGGFTRIENKRKNERADDSWIEVSSQPSDDTYSTSSGDNAVAGPIKNLRRRRRGKRTEITLGRTTDSKAYDNTADDLSEAEIIMARSSSIEELPPHEDSESSGSAAGEEEDDTSEEGEIEDTDEEDTGTMLGVGSRNPPLQGLNISPGRFSTRSVSEFQRSIEPDPRQSFLRHRNPAISNSGRRVPTAPATKADHDEALMASLSTLLSCAAAARALPKAQHQGSVSPGGPSRAPNMPGSRVQLDSLQLLPEPAMPSAAPEAKSQPGDTAVDGANSNGYATPEETARARQSGEKKTSASKGTSKKKDSAREEVAAAGVTEATKRRSSSISKRRSASPRPNKRTSMFTSTLSSTDASLVTLAFSAGAVILLSAISFSAGYAIGRQVGKVEAEAALDIFGRNGSSVVREAQRSGRGLVGGVGRRVVSVAA